MYQVIQIHVDAPAQPSPGQPCNGCGVCCASEPCPLGVLASGRTTGACAALRWRDDVGRYRCGMIEEPGAHLPPGLGWAARFMPRLAARYISAGTGCDCNLKTETDLH